MRIIIITIVVITIAIVGIRNLEVTWYESKAEKAGGRCYKAKGVEPFAQAGHTADCARAEEIKEFAGDGEDQHAQRRQHRQEAIVDDTEAQRLPDEEADVDHNEVVAKGGAEVGDPKSVDSRGGKHCHPRHL